MWRKDSKNWAYGAPSSREHTPPEDLESASDGEPEEGIRTSKRKNKGQKRPNAFWSPPTRKRSRTSSASRFGTDNEEKENVARRLYTPRKKALKTPTKREDGVVVELKSPLSQQSQQTAPQTVVPDSSASPEPDEAVHITPRKQRTLLKEKDTDSPVKSKGKVVVTVDIPQATTATHSTLNVNDAEVDAIKQHVIGKLTGRRRHKLVGLDDEMARVRQLVEQTIVAGEGNSMLLIGSRGSGKSAVTEAVIEEFREEHRGSFHVVKLNGFIHTDDKIALREIWRQLGAEMELDEDAASTNYADTLSRLLALLSHPTDVDAGLTEHVAKSVIFVLDEFDQFTNHPRQTLLYNLFDIAQARKAPIAVLGLTTRIDVAEHLEKRVKSRFSHRYVHFGLPQNLVVTQQICQQALELEEDVNLLNVTSSEYRNEWNASIKRCLGQQETLDCIRRVYYSSKSIQAALTTFLLPVASISSTRPLITLADVATQLDLVQPDSRLSILSGLPALALTMLIAAARLEVILDNNSCNFHMAYDEYSNIAGRARVTSAVSGGANAGVGARLWGRAPARAAWEGLIQAGLLVPVIGASSTAGINDMCRCDVALTEIEDAVPDLDKTLVKWVRAL